MHQRHDETPCILDLELSKIRYGKVVVSTRHCRVSSSADPKDAIVVTYIPRPMSFRFRNEFSPRPAEQ